MAPELLPLCTDGEKGVDLQCSFIGCCGTAHSVHVRIPGI